MEPNAEGNLEEKREEPPSKPKREGEGSKEARGRKKQKKEEVNNNVLQREEKWKGRQDPRRKPQRRVARKEDLKGAGGKDKEEKQMRGGTRMDCFPPKLTHRDSPQDQGKALFTTFSHVATTQDSFKQSIMSWFNFLPPSTNYTSDRWANFSMRMKDNALVYPLDLIDLINLSSFLSSRPRQWVERQDMTGFDLMGTLPCPGRA